MDLAADPPLKVPPLKIQIKEVIELVMATSRQFPPLHRVSLKEHLPSPEEHSLMYRISDSCWSSVANCCKKRRRQLSNYGRTACSKRADNLKGVAIATLGRGSPEARWITRFFSLYFIHFYWQLPPHKSSRDCFTVMTPQRLNTGNRVVMGSADAITFAKRVAERVLKPVLNHGVQLWLDDVLGYAETETKFLDVLKTVLESCENFGVKLHPEKCRFLSFSTVWCERRLQRMD